MSEQAWWIVIVFVTNALTASVIIDTYRRRVYSLRRRYAVELAAVQQETARANVRVRDIGLKERLYGALPYVDIERRGSSE
jgi:hypothetical protein